MDYRKYGETYYLRLDRGDEVISEVLALCRAERIGSAIFSGIGGCSEAEIQIFIPEDGAFETRRIEGMLELVSLTGNVFSDDDGRYCHHVHAVFSHKAGAEHCISAGHIKKIVVLYTAEIELRPVIGGTIGHKYDPQTGTGFWDFR